MKKIFFLLVMYILIANTLHANDYTAQTNAIIQGRVTWQKAIKYIDSGDRLVPPGEERRMAIRSLYKYKNRDLVPYLIRYSQSSDAYVRVATFWPLYANNKQSYAIGLLRKEAKNNSLEVTEIFYMPNAVGTAYQLTLSKGDKLFYKTVCDIATDTTINPWIRLHAAIHLTNIGYPKLALKVGEEILKLTPTEEEINKEYTQRSEQEKLWFHQRKRAEWCIKLAKNNGKS